MNSETKAALEASIVKWEANAKATSLVDLTLNAASCPLCVLHRKPGTDCHGCPVHASTGQHGCRGTPYVDVVNTRFSNLRKVKVHINRELSFLKSLREGTS